MMFCLPFCRYLPAVGFDTRLHMKPRTKRKTAIPKDGSPIRRFRNEELRRNHASWPEGCLPPGLASRSVWNSPECAAQVKKAANRDSVIVAAREIMGQQKYCALATVDSSGQPHVRR